MSKNIKRMFSCVLLLTFLFNISPVFAQDTTGNIIGTVKDNADSAPIENATLILFLRLGGNNLEPVDTTTTDSTGEYEFLNHTAPDRYSIGVSAVGYVVHTEKGISLQPDDTLVIDIALQKISNVNTGVITGMVIDSSDSTPIVDALMILYSSQGGGQYVKIGDTKTNTDGVYAFYQVLAGSNYRIDVSADLYLNASENHITVVAQDTTIVNFALSEEPTGVSVYNNKSVSEHTIKVINGHLVCNLDRTDNAVLTVYSAAGKIIVRKELISGYNNIALPNNIANQVLFAYIKSGVRTSSYRFVLP